MKANGRRIGKRSRVRCGELCDADGSIDSAVNPDDPGSSPDETTDGGDSTIGISIGIGITL